MDITTVMLEWLEDQLETATEQGGCWANKMTDPEPLYVDEVDVLDESSLKVWLTNGEQVTIWITKAV